MESIIFTPPYQTGYTIESECSNIINLLKLKYGDYITESKEKKENTIYIEKQENGYRIIFNKAEIYTTTPFKTLNDIFYENTSYDNGIFALHGAAVEYNKKAYLLLAATSTGKTTLTCFLTLKGFGYIAEDCVLLDRSNFTVYPYSTPIHLRAGGYDILKHNGLDTQKCRFLNDVSFKRYIYIPENIIKTPLPVSKIFFIKRTENSNMTLPMNMTERTISLMKAPIKKYEVNAKYIGFISKLTKIPCCQLLYSDMNYAAEVIKNG